ncbi:MAG: sulfotransferase domain-containing protein [Phycisphaerales bacterium JB059]
MLGLGRTKSPKLAPAPGVVRDARGRVLYRLPAPGEADLPSALAFSFYKAGSTLLRKVLEDLTPEAGVRLVNLEGELFRLGVEHRKVDRSASSVFRPRGYCYGVFRLMPYAYDIPILEDAPKLLLVRDPRDILVSHYFSMSRSHPTPGSKLSEIKAERFTKERERVQVTSVDEHALRKAPMFRKHFAGYAERLLEQPNLRVDRYEDIVFDKRRWIDGICEHLGWDVDQTRRAQVASRHDIVPEGEHEDQHIRRVRPGDHIDKLRPETIEALNEIFAPFLDHYGYDR